MEKEIWKQHLKNQMLEQKMELNERQQEQFYTYMKLLQKWNENINLTAIIEPEEVLQKHFVDSLTILPYIPKNSDVIDIGSGAGFPGIPIKIAQEGIQLTVLDALNKRLIFLQEVIKILSLANVKTIHERAETAGKNITYREQFDIAVSRAVAPLSILVEYLLPFVKLGGKCICMKGSNIEEEIENSQKAIQILGGEIETIQELVLPNSDIKRNIIIIKKKNETPTKYPRKPGIPTKQPIQ